MNRALERVHRLFSLDLRSLGLFRIMLGAILLYDVGTYLSEFNYFLSTEGVYPEEFNNLRGLRLYSLVEADWWTMSLLLLSGVVYFLLLIGYKTPVVVVFAWMLFSSFSSRVFEVQQGGDALMRALLFWGMFLPLGDRYAVSADKSTRTAPGQFFSVVTIALILQVAVMYVATALMKYHPAWWPEGKAIWIALNLEERATDIGLVLKEHRGLARFLTLAAYIIELLAPLLLFIPWKSWFFRLSFVVLSSRASHRYRLNCQDRYVLDNRYSCINSLTTHALLHPP